ncbi:uncharacterized protein RCC_03650 [Ramularia collo-cygni]|uniref:Uncharacterized protein n=1 Tax=Ramularia collo-cygni TaxID=112498 RepID=A0A2D3V5L9_9PEZI|nr:uncharacterized protein RCC_03650 [Ramularia collo-cygni]CZT17814.1 uncharacterized protein RCC_03650 [Ramularia collo-cygni]
MPLLPVCHFPVDRPYEEHPGSIPFLNMGPGITSIFVLSLLTATTWAQSLSPEAIEAALALPECVTKCGIEILPKFNCTIGTDCYCSRKGPIEDAIASCVIGGCPSLGDALAGLKFQALTCGYRTDRNIGPLTSGIAYVLFGLASLFMIARFLSRWPRLRGAGLSWDDGVVLMCYVPVVGVTVCCAMLQTFGAGKDMWTSDIHSVLHYAKWFYASQPFYIFAVFSTKLSLILLYLRIWPRRRGDVWTFFHAMCYIMIFVLMGTAIGATLAMIFSCHPISNAWRYANRAMGTCTDRVAGAYVYGALNIVYDLIVIALPIPGLLRLKVSTGQKIGIMCCFLVGLVATACSIIRMTELQGITTARNITWDFTAAGFWSLVEVYVSMICCCMPAMAGLLKRCWYRAQHRDSMGAFRTVNSPSFDMVNSGKSQVDSTWTMDELDSPGGIAAMPAIEPLQEVQQVHTKA